MRHLAVVEKTAVRDIALRVSLDPASHAQVNGSGSIPRVLPSPESAYIRNLDLKCKNPAIPQRETKLPAQRNASLHVWDATLRLPEHSTSSLVPLERRSQAPSGERRAAMVSYPPSSERQGNAKAGPGNNGQGRAEKTTGTPRKDLRVVKEKAVQVPELRDYVRSPPRRSLRHMLIRG